MCFLQAFISGYPGTKPSFHPPKGPLYFVALFAYQFVELCLPIGQWPVAVGLVLYPVLDLFLLHQLMLLWPQIQLVMLRVSRRQVLHIGVETPQGLDHYTHVVRIVAELGPRLEVL